MLRLAADENVDARVVRGLLLRLVRVDLIRVQGAGLAGASDPEILAWAASEGRVLLTHDIRTMIGFAGERLAQGQPMPGLVVMPQTESIGLVLDALEQLVRTNDADDLTGRILYLRA